jgi:hypothetical protein
VLEKVPIKERLLRALMGLEKVAWLDVMRVPITTLEVKLALFVLERVPEIVRLLRAEMGLEKVA